jgi:hypothetical protein
LYGSTQHRDPVAVSCLPGPLIRVGLSDRRRDQGPVGFKRRGPQRRASPRGQIGTDEKAAQR